MATALLKGKKSQGTMTSETLTPTVAWLQEISRQIETLTKGQLTHNKQIEQIIRGHTETLEIQKELLNTIKTQTLLGTQEPEIIINGGNSTLTELNTKVCTFIDFIREDKERKYLTENAYKFRKTHKGDWCRIVNQRKLAFYEMIKAKHLSDIYKDLIEREDQYIPRKFRETEIQGESQEQKERKKQIAVERVKKEIARLQEVSTKKVSILDKCETDIKFVIQLCPDPATRQKLIELYMEEIRKEQNISEGMWNKKEDWYKKLPENEAKLEEEEKLKQRKESERRERHYRGSYNHTKRSYSSVVRNGPVRYPAPLNRNARPPAPHYRNTRPQGYAQRPPREQSYRRPNVYRRDRTPHPYRPPTRRPYHGYINRNTTYESPSRPQMQHRPRTSSPSEHQNTHCILILLFIC